MALFSKQSFKNFKAKLPTYLKNAKEIVKKRWWIMLIEFVALGVLIALDLVSKHYAVAYFDKHPGETYELIPGVIHLTYSENTGAGFGMFAGNTTALTVITFIVIFGVLMYLIFAQKQNEWLRASLLLIVGGGIGNLVDRIGLDYVRDFIDYAFLKNFAICNVADAFVTVGAVMLVIVLIVMLVKEGRKNQKEFEKEQAGKAPEQGVDPLDAPIPLNPMMSSPNDYTFEESAQSDERPQSDIDAQGESFQNAESSAEGGAESEPTSGDSSAEGSADVQNGQQISDASDPPTHCEEE